MSRFLLYVTLISTCDSCSKRVPRGVLSNVRLEQLENGADKELSALRGIIKVVTCPAVSP